jgi:hypothetical protein
VLKRSSEALLWGGGLFLLSRIPFAVHALPCLALLRGRLGFALVGLALLYALHPILPKRGFAARGWLLFLGAFLFFLALGLPYAARIQPSGDEPHYLLMAQSLWREGDLDLRDNLARGDYREYLPGDKALIPHYAAPRADGRPFPAHSPGLPALLAPVYALGGRAACVALMAALSALLALLTRALCLRVGSPEGARLAWAGVLLPPLAFYSFHLYTEVPSAVALAGSLGILLGAPGPIAASGAALLAACLPWLHVKMIPAAGALGVLALIRLRGRPLLAFLLVAGLGALLFCGYYESVFGHPTPLAIYGGIPRDASGSPLQALPGLLLDRAFGLLPYAPIMLLALSGLVPLARGRSRDVLPHLLVAGAVLLPLLPWRMWWGGQSPPARFLVPLLPQLGVGLGARVGEGKRGLVRWAPALLAYGLGLCLLVVSLPEERLLLTHGDRPPRILEALSPGLGRYLPSVVQPTSPEWRVAALWAVALLGLLVLDRLALRNDRVDRLFGGLGFPLVLLLAMGVLVDSWARPERASPGGETPGLQRVSSRGAGASASGPGPTRRLPPG